MVEFLFSCDFLIFPKKLAVFLHYLCDTE